MGDEQAMAALQLTKEQVDQALDDLDKLCQEEYGYGIADLIADPDAQRAAMRLQRLTGVLLKRKFATPLPIGNTQTETGSRRAWQWSIESFLDPGLVATPEFAVLDQLRLDLPRQLENNYATGYEPTFDDLADQAEHERGLFKVLALWVADKLEKREGHSIRDYFEAEESPRLEAALDASTAIFQAGIGPVLAPLLPIPGVVVSLILIGVRFGYRSITHAPEIGDRYS